MWLIAIVMGAVEGITEFLPISSTGHLILTGHLLHFTGPKANLYEIVIQSGAIFAVMWEYRARLISVTLGITHDKRAQRFALNILIAFLPLAALGLWLKNDIEMHLFKPIPVALAFIVGGLIILWVERKGGHANTQTPRISEIDDLRWNDALKLGLAQAVALIPGTSRSGATIIGGMLFGLSRKAATEFSFFLAIPTLLGASAYKLVKEQHLLSMDDLSFYAIGLCAAFISAFFTVRILIRYVSTHTFIPFAWYRIAFGILVLVTAQMGWVQWGH